MIDALCDERRSTKCGNIHHVGRHAGCVTIPGGPGKPNIEGMVPAKTKKIILDNYQEQKAFTDHQ